MENSIKICMSKEDADMVEKIFDMDDDPNFTVLNRYNFPGESDTVQLEIICDCTLHLWSLAKRVEMWETHEKKMKEITENIKKQFGI